MSSTVIFARRKNSVGHKKICSCMRKISDCRKDGYSIKQRLIGNGKRILTNKRKIWNEERRKRKKQKEWKTRKRKNIEEMKCKLRGKFQNKKEIYDGKNIKTRQERKWRKINEVKRNKKGGSKERGKAWSEMNKEI